MPIEFTCPSCGAKQAAADRLAGRSLRCQGCGGDLTVPPGSARASSGGTSAPRDVEEDEEDLFAQYRPKRGKPGSK